MYLYIFWRLLRYAEKKLVCIHKSLSLTVFERGGERERACISICMHTHNTRERVSIYPQNLESFNEDNHMWEIDLAKTSKIFSNLEGRICVRKFCVR